MKVYEAAAIRNVAVVGHGGCGKTQLVSAALLAAGAVNRLGLVDDGSTVMMSIKATGIDKLVPVFDDTDDAERAAAA